MFDATKPYLALSSSTQLCNLKSNAKKIISDGSATLESL
jgi:hypothetical protein